MILYQENKEPEEVSGELFHKLRVRFIPEYKRGRNGKVVQQTIYRTKWNG